MKKNLLFILCTMMLISSCSIQARPSSNETQYTKAIIEKTTEKTTKETKIMLTSANYRGYLQLNSAVISETPTFVKTVYYENTSIRLYDVYNYSRVISITAIPLKPNLHFENVKITVTGWSHGNWKINDATFGLSYSGEGSTTTSATISNVSSTPPEITFDIKSISGYVIIYE